MRNLLQETIEILKSHGKTPDDVLWCGSDSFGWFTWKDFEEIASDAYYDEGFGAQEVAYDLLVVGKDFWLKRREYDGAEDWEFLTLPERPTTYKKPVALTVHQTYEKFGDNRVGWRPLEDLNKKWQPSD